MCLSNLILLTLTEFTTTTRQSLTTNKSPTENKMRPSTWHSYTSKQLKEIHYQIRPTNLTGLPFWTIRTIWELRLNNRTRKITNRKTACDRISTQNLRQIATTDENNDEIVKNIRFLAVNARLIKSKENIISNKLTNRKIDILITTETWLQDIDQDEAWTAASKLGHHHFKCLTKQKQLKRRGNCPNYKQKLQSITIEGYACLLQL